MCLSIGSVDPELEGPANVVVHRLLGQRDTIDRFVRILVALRSCVRILQIQEDLYVPKDELRRSDLTPKIPFPPSESAHIRYAACSVPPGSLGL